MPIHPENTRPAYLDVAEQQWTERQHFMEGITVGTNTNSAMTQPLILRPAPNATAILIEPTTGGTTGNFLTGQDLDGGSGFNLGWSGEITIFKSGTAGVYLFPTNVTDYRMQLWADVAGSFVMVGNVASPAVPGEMGRVSLTAQAAAIAATDLTAATPAGLYEVSYYASCTTANAIDGTIGLRLAYTDPVGATTQSAIGTLSLAATSTGTTALKGVMVVHLASGNITYETILVGGQTTSRYALEVRCKYLG